MPSRVHLLPPFAPGIATRVSFERGEIVFNQGDAADYVAFVERGTVAVTMISPEGKEACLSIVASGDVVGEECLVGRHVRDGTARAVTDAALHVVQVEVMKRELHANHDFADVFIAKLLVKIVRQRDSLIDAHFNDSRHRLARTLWTISRLNREPLVEYRDIPYIPQELLAEMVGTTRSRVNAFITEFRQQGHVHYTKGSRIRVFNTIQAVLEERSGFRLSEAARRETPAPVKKGVPVQGQKKVLP